MHQVRNWSRDAIDMVCNRIVIKTGIEMGNETKSAYSIVEDNHNIMHSYTIIYARSTCLCIKQDSRWQISLHGAYRLDRDIKRLLLSEGLGTL